MRASCKEIKELFELAYVRYPSEILVLEKACSLLEKKTLQFEVPYFSDGFSVALILGKMDADFSIVLSSLFYLPVKHKIVIPGEWESLCNPEALNHLKWLFQIKDFKDFCTEFLNQSKNDDTYKDLDLQRLVIILAFFLHRIRKIDSLSSDKEKEELALDGVDIYSAFAEKIGISSIKREIEDLAFRSLNPNARVSILEILESLSGEYQAVAKYIINKLDKSFAKVGIKNQIFWRQKSPYSIWLKMLKKNQPFDKIVDILGMRILVNSVDDCYRVLGIIHSDNMVLPGFFDDFINIPKPNGYQSIHTVILAPLEHKIEVQIRTYQMQEQSEQGSVAHWVYKNQIHKNLTLGNKSLEALTSKDFFVDEKFGVFCSLTDGSKIYLSSGGIVLDVAFKISYGVGMSCIGAKVNGENASLLRKVCSGDRVEILTSGMYEFQGIDQSGTVDPEIKEYFKKYFLDKNWSQCMHSGERTLKNLCSVFRIRSLSSLLEYLSKSFGLTSVEDLLSRVGRGDLPMSKLIDFIGQQHGDHGYRLRLGNFLKLRLAKLGISFFRRAHFTYDQVELAKCCNPVPGDSVVGCFSVSSGLVVHRVECLSLKKLPVRSKIITIKVTNSRRDSKYLSYLKIAFFKKESNFSDAYSIMSKLDASIYNMNTDEFFIELIYMIKVHNAVEINSIISFINTKNSAFRVSRILCND